VRRQVEGDLEQKPFSAPGLTSSSRLAAVMKRALHSSSISASGVPAFLEHARDEIM